ncbi:hypothetical protein [Tropicibacter naphthalenivorans]|uniref:2-keto-4-pentenoate hydratase n=1 Tax=Tropicibacter naphthalenivorans TaxID=441103 RepID=A0A0P1GQD2_9RHOB|nr:hypothetical protein [Tropicibacter naphthalenivorans]CUH76339.1 2-keto-4-pentenoate hydratase [Tropicibacter naphthalenivorans]SMC67758.1 2-oxohept-3-enedioate hydratase [Tropicibacter naphthalenivorans]
MTPDNIHQAARDLVEAERAGQQIGPLSLAYPQMDRADAYAIQAAVTTAKLVDRRRILGWQIGLMPGRGQSALGGDTPSRGVLFDDMLFETGGVVPEGRVGSPCVTAEIAFVMKAPLKATPSGGITREEVVDAIDYICPALRLLDPRIRQTDPETGQRRTPCDIIADNAGTAGIVLGETHRSPRLIDLRWVGAIVARDGEVEETGLGASVLNDPVAGMVWLAERMAQNGHRIDAGQVVLSGSLVRPVGGPRGSIIEADFGALGDVAITFA